MSETKDTNRCAKCGGNKNHGGHGVNPNGIILCGPGAGRYLDECLQTEKNEVN